MKILLDNGADPNALAHRGFTPLHLVLYMFLEKSKCQGNQELAEKLILVLLTAKNIDPQ